MILELANLLTVCLYGKGTSFEKSFSGVTVSRAITRIYTTKNKTHGMWDFVGNLRNKSGRV